MKRIRMGVLTAVLLLCTLFTSVACRAEEAWRETAAFVPDGAFVLVCPDGAAEEESAACRLLARGLKSAYGIDCEGGTDAAVHEYEILVGETARAASQSLFEELSYYDWSYEIVSPRCVAVCGGSPEATAEAVRAFLDDVIGYTEDPHTEEILTEGSAVSFCVGEKRSYRHTYDAAPLRLGRRDLSEYTIVCPDAVLETAERIADHFNRLMGVKLPIVSLDEYGEGPAIFFGCAGTDGAHLPLYEGYGTLRYFITEINGNVVVDFKIKGVAALAARRFIDACSSDAAEASHAVSFSGANTVTGVDIPAGTNSLCLESADKRVIARGITYEERLYSDANGKPVRAYALTVASGAATLATLLPDDQPALGKLSRIPNQLKAAYENGKNVIAGINGDFFDINGTKMVNGLCIREGELLHGHDGRPWFGVTKDGQPVLGAVDEYAEYASELMSAVGGSNIVLRYDRAAHVSVEHEFGYTRHPRTAVGIKPDGSVTLLVVDGRQSSLSNGASLADLADILASFGCTSGINLDGGGSSTFVLRDTDGSFEVMNSPSDGSPRAVANGIAVVLP